MESHKRHSVFGDLTIRIRGRSIELRLKLMVPVVLLTAALLYVMQRL